MMSPAQHLHWGAEALWRGLGPLLPGLSVEVVAHTDSTNSALIERARRSGGLRDTPISQPGAFDPADDPRTPHGRRAGDTQPCLLVAEHQTRGRGRLGRTWQSSPGASLTFSLALPFAPVDWSGLSLAVGVALADALDPPDETRSARIGLKWPNDLWLALGGSPGRKLGGILIETLPVGERRMCIIGVGLNVLPQQTEDLSNGYACWQEVDPQAGAPALLATVAEPLVRALLRFEREGLAAFESAYARRDLLRGHVVTTTLSDVPQGVAEGIDASGALRVRAGSTLHTLVAGEVSVRPAGDGQSPC
jgi:BirA family transcriptional regulator, biotin operon repressor / biotin---[acetyl-CoA-carboxylase] ligase